MGDCPVVEVDWFESREFALWAKCEMPTEIQWEYAARGLDNLIYPWGNEWHDEYLVWDSIWGENSSSHPNSVISKPEGASWVGAQHLSGNVWEWLLNLYKNYPHQERDTKENSTSITDARVMRGGSWLNSDWELFHTTNRSKAIPTYHIYSIGFRCAFPY